jgi:hypothetical protein
MNRRSFRLQFKVICGGCRAEIRSYPNSMGLCGHFDTKNVQIAQIEAKKIGLKVKKLISLSGSCCNRLKELVLKNPPGGRATPIAAPPVISGETIAVKDEVCCGMHGFGTIYGEIRDISSPKRQWMSSFGSDVRASTVVLVEISLICEIFDILGDTASSGSRRQVSSNNNIDVNTWWKRP